MKQIVISLTAVIFIIANIGLSQDIINETGREGKFIVRDIEQKEVMVIDDGNVDITGELSVEYMSEGSDGNPIVVWDRETNKLKTLSSMSNSWHSFGYNAVDEDGNEISTDDNILTWNQFNTDNGYIKLGPANDLASHIYTDMPIFLFNKPVYSKDGSFSSFKSNNLNLQTNGTTQVTILESNGNVGIGTTSPGEKLHIVGNMRLDGNFKDKDGDIGAPGEVLSSTGSGTDWVTASSSSGVDADWTISGTNLYSTPSGNVGIGTDNPFSKLSVVGGLNDPNVAIRGETSSTSGRGVIGLALNEGQVSNYGGYFEARGYDGRGVYGESWGSTGHGVEGYATNEGDVSNQGGYFVSLGVRGSGVQGWAQGSSGKGVNGWASNSGNVTNYGGSFTAAGSFGRGVFGRASNEGNETNYGGYFEASGVTGRGVHGESRGVSGIGVYGDAWGVSGIGIYGSGGAYAGYFDGGDVHVSESLQLLGSFKDKDGDIGAPGEVLSSTGSGTDWVTASSSSGVDADWTISGTNLYSTPSGNVGVGNNNPEAKLHVSGDDGVIFNGTLDDLNNPISTMLKWYPKKAAFRVGYNQNGYWNDENVGNYSIAMGSDTHAGGIASTAIGNFSTASGDYSTAIGGGTTASAESSTAFGGGTRAEGIASTATGFNTVASGNWSTAMGIQTIASGQFSTALGWDTDAIGEVSTAMGSYTEANNYASTAMGENTVADGSHSTAMGHETNAIAYASTSLGKNTTASGEFSTAMGNNTTANGDQSTAMGLGINANSFSSLAIGQYNVDVGYSGAGWNELDPLFEIGNGQDEANRSNAMTVLKNGNVGIGTIHPNSKLSIVGLSEYADNAEALSYNLVPGDLYRTGDLLKVVH